MHELHRERLRKKLLQNGEMLEDHELLELLLFYAIPRKNTNPIAHQLLTAFGSIQNVLKADPTMLMSIAGIGESSATFLNALGIVLERCKGDYNLPEIFSFEQIREPIKNMFSASKSEVFIAFFLDKKQKIIGRKIICDHSTSKVEINLAELAKHVVAVQPSFVVIAHNHLSGIASPTPNDDGATEKIMLMLKLYNVTLVDHLIVTSGEVYSYYYDNRIDKIRKKVQTLI